jgi:hypothetical protein
VNELTLICGPCGLAILGDTGCLRVSHGAIKRHQRETAEWNARHPGDAHDLTELLTLPDEVQWVAWHDKCRPAGFDDGYEIDSVRLSTWSGLAHWTAHLMSKRWLDCTDWDDVLREAAGEIPSRRIRAVRNVAA